MKYNKREKLAIRALDKIINALSGGTTAVLSVLEGKALHDCIGFDIWKATSSKAEINTLVRGKDVPVVLIVSKMGCNYPPRNCFFPFQVKEYRNNLITCPRCQSQVRETR